MNDAHPPRRDAVGGPGRDPRRPEPPYDGPDGYDGYDPLAQDPYGGQYQQQPADPYAQDAYAGQYQQPAQDPYAQDPYAGQYQQEGYGYDPYGAQSAQSQSRYADPYGTGTQPRVPQQGHDPGGYHTGTYPEPGGGQYPPGGYDTGRQPAVPYDTGQYDPGGYDTGSYAPGDLYAQQAPLQAQRTQQPRQAPPPTSDNPYDELGELAERDDDGEAAARGTREKAADYHTGQFSFVEDEEDEEVIDWLKFAETRTERRDERKRRGRSRGVALVVVLVLALVGGLGYLWQQGKLPFLGADTKAAAPASAQKRDVIVVHLMEPDSERSSTALLVNNETAGKGTTVLLPNTLAINTDDGESTRLGKSVGSSGAGPTRDGLSALLGADIKGTWRLDTPFLELLVESVGGIQVDTDTEVRGTGKQKGRTLVPKGEKQGLNGVGAVAYATHLGPKEAAGKQLARFGAVLESVLKKLPSTPEGATETVQSLGQVADPSLPDGELGASLAPLAEEAKTGSYTTRALPVRSDGTLDDETSKGVVKDVLGGTVKNADPGAAPSVRVQNATGRVDAGADAKVTLVNSGYTFVQGGKARTVVARSTVEYGDASQAALAQEVAQTLGLPKSALRKAAGGDRDTQIKVVLGQDYEG